MVVSEHLERLKDLATDENIRKVFGVLPTESEQMEAILQFVSYLGYKVVIINDTWHFVGDEKETKGLTLSLKDAVMLYNNCDGLTDEVIWSADSYGVTSSMLESFSKIKTFSRLKLRRRNGKIEAGGNFLEFLY